MLEMKKDFNSKLKIQENSSSSNGGVSGGNNPPSIPPPSLPLLQTVRIFKEESTYTFYALRHPPYDLTTASFYVHTNHFVLLNEFSLGNNHDLVFKEYLVSVFYNRFSFKFKLKRSSFAFINTIEVVFAPYTLISGSA
ncbi:hypothetical protein PIB30_028669 [Stylosanthes scabra]|uniref:Uncharacterized protein n=1 Tax=Stylosanthes scabra TaxID=79078 RepID=A0ABU6SBU4_9FABA|nr:hypothetical protein [Stylosanthes scabra]